MFLGDDPEDPHPKVRGQENAPIVLSRPLPQSPAALPAKLTRNGWSSGTEAAGYTLKGAGLDEHNSAWSLKEPPIH